jgi:hypothetical protein
MRVKAFEYWLVVLAHRRTLLAIFAGNDPVAIELDFVQPTRSGRRPVGQRRLARQNEAGGLERERSGRETRQSIPAQHLTGRGSDCESGAKTPPSFPAGPSRQKVRPRKARGQRPILRRPSESARNEKPRQRAAANWRGRAGLDSGPDESPAKGSTVAVHPAPAERAGQASGRRRRMC